MKPTPIWSQQSWSQQSMYEGLDEEAENGPNQSGRSVDRLCLRLSFLLLCGSQGRLLATASSEYSDRAEMFNNTIILYG
jgi:hypothetical protein